MTEPEKKRPEKCLLSGIKTVKAGKSILAYLCFVDCCQYVRFFFFFSPLIHRIWSLMLKKTLKY